MSTGVKLQVALSLSVNCLTSGNSAVTPGARARMTISLRSLRGPTVPSRL